MAKSPLNVAWVEFNSQERVCQQEPSSYPRLSCTSFVVDKDFRLSFRKNHYDAVVCICDSSSLSETRAMFEWIRSVRCSKVPLMLLCDTDDEATMTDALYAGADDVQVMPVRPNVLSARVVALCTRTSLVQAASERMGKLQSHS